MSKLDISRRRFGALVIGNTALRTIPLAGSAFVLFPGRAAAQADPVTIALAAVQLAVSLSNLFGPKGPSLADLLTLQTQMLAKISAQLSVIQQSLSTIYSSLDELKDLVRAVPDETVMKLYKSNIAGALVEYGEVMDAYSSDVAQTGINSAQTNNINEIDKVIDQIRQARDALMTFKNETTLPIVCAALQTEIHSMIMANTPLTRKRAALGTYKIWISPFLDQKSDRQLLPVIAGLEDLIRKSSDTLRNDRDRLINNYTCYSNVSLQVHFDGQMHFTGAAGTQHTLSVSRDVDFATLTTSSFASLSNAGETFIDQATGFQDSTINIVDAPFTGDGAIATAIGTRAPSQGSMSAPFFACPYDPFWPMGKMQSFLQNEYDEMSSIIMKYIAYKSFHLCARDALVFIDRMNSELT